MQNTGNRNGFTLIELLVVLFIVGILVALAVNVGSRVINEANRKETITIQKIAMRAVEKYRDDKDEYPNDPNYLFANTAATKILMNLPKDALQNNVIYDAYDRPMRYDPTGGMGGVPVWISDGLDGDPNTDEDNIRSDDN